ncbi:MAG: ABC-F type ribosomal protection protein [Chitinispirillales bacterium]|jgi:lincosamide and streptogramin A transport system ATP-binding/permease protein|nr:ABC-F type ribosomal protection protein [Chitinispirillales bacterium]
MSLINISNLTFAYDGSYDNIFENVSFQIDTNWRLGFTGRNGRGKTTFLNLLLGKYKYSGIISGNVDFLYFPFDIAGKGQLTLDVTNSINPDFEIWQLERELSLLDVDTDILYRTFGSLSNGEQTKVLLAVLFLQDNGYLLIDEPANHLDVSARQTVSKYIRSKKSFILVSHDRAFLDASVDHILSINKTNIEVQKGNFSSWLENKEKQDNFEIAKNEKLEKDIGRLKSSAKRISDWSDSLEDTKYGTKNSGLRPNRGYIGHKSAKMMGRAKSIEKKRNTLIEEKSRLLKNIEEAAELKIHPLVYYKRRLATFEDVSVFYDKKQACGKISFTIEQGDRIALCGKNGSGKSSIIKLIRGEDISYTGNIQKGSDLIISYVSQDTSYLQGNLSEFAQINDIDESLFKAILRKLDFSRVQFEKDISNFSAGQKKKVLVAKSLCEKAHLYIWDEPLNFIDVLSRIQIEKLLLQYKPAMVFVEHDKTFTDVIASKKVEL